MDRLIEELVEFRGVPVTCALLGVDLATLWAWRTGARVPSESELESIRWAWERR